MKFRKMKTESVTMKIILALLTFFVHPFSLFAVNDIQFTTGVDTQLITNDTATSAIISAESNGIVSSMLIESNSIDITLDNGSAITFSTADDVYFVATVQSGTGENITPACPQQSISLSATGNVTIRLEISSGIPACATISSGGGGGGSSSNSNNATTNQSENTPPANAITQQTQETPTLTSPTNQLPDLATNCASLKPGSQNNTCRADISADNVIDILDFNMVMVQWGQTQGDPSDPSCTNKLRADINCDSEVNIIDFNFLMIYWSNQS